jgi:hypothetical protein
MRSDAMNKRTIGHQRRRATDQFASIMQRVALVGGAIGVVYGQAELLGEPWRHYITVGFTVILVGVAIWMKET